jgi:hypothetical protein
MIFLAQLLEGDISTYGHITPVKIPRLRSALSRLVIGKQFIKIVGYILDFRMIRCHAKTHQAVGSRQSFEEIDATGSVVRQHGRKIFGSIASGRPAADHGHSKRRGVSGKQRALVRRVASRVSTPPARNRLPCQESASLPIGYVEQSGLSKRHAPIIFVSDYVEAIGLDNVEANGSDQERVLIVIIF